MFTQPDSASASLPPNPDGATLEALLARLHEQAAEATRQAAEATRLKASLQHAETKIQALTLELAHLKRLRYGVKSEALTAEQRDLFQETLETDLAAVEAETERAAPTPRKKRERAGRQPLPPHLPRIEIRHEPDACTCGQCGQGLVQIGEDISEQLDIEPAKFTVIRHIRPQYACRTCETVTAAPVPAAVIDGGLATPALLAWVGTCKYADHLPLYRVEQIAARQGVPLPRSTLADWMGRIGVALQPLADRLAEWLRQEPVLHGDETPLEQLDPGSGKTRKAYLWAYRNTTASGGPPIVVFDYQPGRSGSHASTFLGDWRGRLMVDDYAGYKALFKTGISELACWAHARRKFYELHAANGSPIAREALARIGQLYEIEARGRELGFLERAALRREEARPILDALFEWMWQTRKAVAEGSGTARALDYSLKRWEALVRYAETGDAPIDNNAVENAIRPIAIGKKNWLFAGSERAGKRAAAIQTLFGTARLNGLDPYTWLRYTLEKLPTWPYSRIDELLPLRCASSA